MMPSGILYTTTFRKLPIDAPIAKQKTAKKTSSNGMAALPDPGVAMIS